MNIGIILVNFILIQMKDIRVLQKISIVGVCTVLYNSIALCILSWTGFIHNGKQPLQYSGIPSLDWQTVSWFSFKSDALSLHTQAISSILYCFINHQMVFLTCKSLKNPTGERLSRVFFLSNFT